MKIYLAANYSSHPEMRDRATDLEAMGHEVTSRWIQGNHSVEDAPGSDRTIWAQEDLEDLRSAHCCISFTCEPGKAKGRNRGGRHVEFGVALERGLLVVVIGHRENVFHELPEVMFYATWEEFLSAWGNQDV